MHTVLRSVIAKMIQTYGIPTISGLLTTTEEFSSAETANKRFADTSILIQEFVSSTVEKGLNSSFQILCF
jgi:hypothetical protein